MIRKTILSALMVVIMLPSVTCHAEQPKLEPIQNSIKQHKAIQNDTKWVSLPVYDHDEFKAYMDGMCITDVTSKAYAQKSKMTVNSNGLYAEDKYIGIAVNRFYGSVGDKFRITLSSGKIFYAVMTDTKQDRHVDENYADANGGVIEFIVDVQSLPEDIRIAGSLNRLYPGTIKRIERKEDGN